MNLASRGLRDMDGGSESIADKAEAERVRKQAMRVHAKALLSALLVTGVVLAIRV